MAATIGHTVGVIIIPFFSFNLDFYKSLDVSDRGISLPMEKNADSSSECADEDDEKSDESPSSGNEFSRDPNRKKRGKYRKYSMELKREIGRYAQTHGKQSAIEHFSSELGFTLSESTVRHFVRQCGNPTSPPPGLIRRKARLAYSREFRAQVGEFASEYGNSKARDHFETNLGVRVPESTIRDMKKWFLSRHDRQESSDRELDSKCQDARIPPPEVTIQWLDPSVIKKREEDLELPVPDVTIERLPNLVSRAVGTNDKNSPDPFSDEELDVHAPQREQDFEAEEAALRLLDLSRGHLSGVSRVDRSSRDESPQIQHSNEFVERFRKKYTQDLKYEIGRYALIHGVSAARRVYSERIGRILPRTSVRDMMSEEDGLEDTSRLLD
ncbi:unnamed protein product [Notodromas monacha]|uniref:Uncharacterized protein n=1 Tax=Notodromas monacha TaxID=399045 RepID=A0A7R9BPM0_9CRUS|nr:unnamed protein product [Notodromas monacha]CAG0917988.1 unnamed protein product [Notodromas monacha]